MDKRIALITGVSSGIGKATAELFKDKCIEIIGIDRVDCSCSIDKFYRCDLTEADQIASVFSHVYNEISHLDIVVNVAGVFQISKRNIIADMDLMEWNNMIANNLTSVMLVTKYCLPLLKSGKSSAIVNIASDQAFFPRRKNAAYSVSKAGVLGFSRSCAEEFLEYGIRVNAVAPASVQTAFIDSLFNTKEDVDRIYYEQNCKMPFGLISAQDVAKTVLFLADQQYGKITGQTIIMDSGLYI